MPSTKARAGSQHGRFDFALAEEFSAARAETNAFDQTTLVLGRELGRDSATGKHHGAARGARGIGRATAKATMFESVVVAAVPVVRALTARDLNRTWEMGSCSAHALNLSTPGACVNPKTVVKRHRRDSDFALFDVRAT